MPRICIASILLLLSIQSFSQPYYSDSALVSNSSEYLKNLYNKSRNNYAPLYTGLIHYPYPSNISGSPYLNSEWQRGNVVFEKIMYENVLMKYDLVKDQLIVVSAEQNSVPLQLFSPRVKEFSIMINKFVFFDIRNSFSLKEGFYQLLVEGKVTALCKTQRVLQETISGTQIERRFDQIKKYYIIKDGKSFLINNKKDLTDALKDYKKAVAGKMKEIKLNFKKNKEPVITAVSQVCNQQN